MLLLKSVVNYYKMYNFIIISYCLFGSVYIFSKSLNQLNESLLEKKLNHKLFIINGLTFIISGSIFIYSVNFLKLTNKK